MVICTLGLGDEGSEGGKGESKRNVERGRRMS